MAPTTPRTDKQRLADLLLGQPVEEWIAARRPDTSWEKIAAELTQATQGGIEVTDMTVRRWMTDQLDDIATDTASAGAM